jgi:hypothetical protein
MYGVAKLVDTEIGLCLLDHYKEIKFMYSFYSGINIFYNYP